MQNKYDGLVGQIAIFVLMHIYTLGVRQYSNEFGIALTYHYICKL